LEYPPATARQALLPHGARRTGTSGRVGEMGTGTPLDEILKNYLKGCPLYVKHGAIGDPAQEILKLI